MTTILSTNKVIRDARPVNRLDFHQTDQAELRAVPVSRLHFGEAAAADDPHVDHGALRERRVFDLPPPFLDV
eukprot:CAMPEP_0171226556 /NCGR_PEP_ID=MMETSP0790-20130122/37392_1 /TAXON_ID=2925 /ORGANISM="Alexandrium catenella, Strain OF101" /LENGTH=71 /DNA_ID=CAMNT_0011692641 /DNA_START=113 /DNA_END=329 /DNA_ORIENTATION=-